MHKNRIDVHIEKNSFVDEGDGSISFPEGLTVTDDSEQWNGTKYDISSMDTSTYKGQVTADHIDMIDRLIAGVEGVKKVGNKVVVQKINYLVKENPLAQLAYNLVTSKKVPINFSIETAGPYPDPETGVYFNAKLIGLSQVVVGNNKNATINQIVHNSIAQAKEAGLDTSKLEEALQLEEEQPANNKKPEEQKQQNASKVTPEDEQHNQEEDMKFVTIKNKRDFAIKVAYKNAAGEDAEQELAPGSSIDVSEEQQTAVETQLNSAQKPQPDVNEVVKNAVEETQKTSNDRIAALEDQVKTYKEAFDKGAQEPEFRKPGEHEVRMANGGGVNKTAPQFHFWRFSMPRSLVRGDYSLVMAVESSSRPNSWYRVLADRQSGLLSCDCPVWTFNRQEDEQGYRACQHTIVANRLVSSNQVAAVTSQQFTPAILASQLLVAAQTQWPGLRGFWSIEERDANIGTKPYHFVLLRLAMGNGGTATGVVAFANAHHHNVNEMIPGVAGWGGYAIAAEVARLAGHPFMGQLPEYFRIDRRPTTGRNQRRTQPHSTSTPSIPSIGLEDILRVGDIVRPGTNPKKVAEDTLRLFVGEEVFSQLERQGFLDVSSAKHRGRVYRLRRDPNRERRVRVMQDGNYISDHCIVSAMECPPDDLYLTVMLGLMSDEEATLAVVNPHYNIFSRNSDGNERETIPAIWQPRATATMA